MAKTTVRKRRSRKIKVIVFLLTAVFLVIGFLLFFQKNINPIIISISEATVKSVTTSSINDAVYSSISNDIKYNDLVTVSTDSAGNITMLQANSIKINELARVTAKKAEENLQTTANQTVYIPIGTFTGSPLLSGHGPNISVKIIPVGAVTTKFLSEFEEAGINQTRHKIFLEINASVSIILPVTDNTILTKTQILICETILVGKVPEFFLSMNGNGGMLDLVP